MAHYYDISLKNTRRVEAREVRLNGVPLVGLHAIGESGRLEFQAPSASPSGQKTIIGGFKSMSGMDSEVEIADYAAPGVRRTLKGRVTSVLTRAPSPTSRGPEYYEVTFTFDKIA